MKDRKLATRYARALLGALADKPAQDRADAFLQALRDAITDNLELRGFLLNPAVPTPSKISLLETLAANRGAPEVVSRFLATVVVHGRVAHLPSIAEVFNQVREAAQGSITATLTTAAPVSKDLEARAAAALARLSGRRVNLKVEVDPGLLGGAVTRIGSMVYDGSIETQLQRLRRTMGEE